MDKVIYSLDCEELSLLYSFLYSDTFIFFGDYLEKYVPQSTACEHIIAMNCENSENVNWLIDENERSLSFREFQSLMLATGNILLQFHRALFHGAALLWRGKVWILTAPSGTGKTTQLRHWRRILKREVQVINGDKPLLVCREDGSVWVHSSPWCGKERYGKPGLSAPLGGIILLQQGQENRMERMNVEESVRPLFTEFVSYPETKDQILCQSDILSRILDVTPVWKLVNLGDSASAELTHQVLSEHLGDSGELPKVITESRGKHV